MNVPVLNNPLPQNYEAERSVLGAMLLNPDAIDKAVAILGEDENVFYNDANRQIFKGICDLVRAGTPVDMVTLTESLVRECSLDRAGGVLYIAELTDAVPTSANAEYYAEIVREMASKREIIEICNRCSADAFDTASTATDLLSAIESKVFSLTDKNGNSQAMLVSSLVPDEMAELNAMLHGEPPKGIRTGYKDLDKILKGFAPSDYVILAACPSVGKTTLACNIALNAMRKDNISVLFLSLEMSREAITRKMLGICGGVNISHIEHGIAIDTLSEKHLDIAAKELDSLSLYIDDEGGISPLQLRAKIRQAVQKYNVELVIVDYLQLMGGSESEGDQVRISNISRGIKLAAKEARVPILALSQFNRNAAEGRPRLSHLRQSGAIEQDCDIAMLMSRSEDENDTDVIIVDVAKQRTGPTGECKLFFKLGTQQFANLGYEPDPVDVPEPAGEAFDEFVEATTVVTNMPDLAYTEDEAGELF